MKDRYTVSICLIISIFFSSYLVAESEVEQSKLIHSKQLSSDVVEKLASKWGITVEEYQRYTDIINGPLGKWNPEIDPIFALGIFAENEEEKQRYAEMYAKQEYELVVRTQAFERAYRKSFSEQFPEAKIIEHVLMQEYYAYQNAKKANKLSRRHKSRFYENDRILYFIDVNCSDCSSHIEKLYKIQQENHQLYIDLYLLGISTEQEARAWAVDNAIDIELVKQEKVTINVDNGTFSQLKHKSPSNTHFYLHRGNDIFSIDPLEIYLK